MNFDTKRMAQPDASGIFRQKPNGIQTMSILRDLEPQNAKIHQNASSGTTTKLAWMFGGLLLLGGVAWLAFYLQTGKNATAGDTAAPFLPSSQESSATKADRKELASAAQESARSEPAPAASVAVIREDVAAQASAKAAKSDPPNVFQTMQMELEKSQSDKVAANTPPQNQAQKSAVTVETPKSPTSKPANEASKQQKVAATHGSTAQRTAKSDKRYAERDIEIITAIVK